jgi:hypothetical protein
MTPTLERLFLTSRIVIRLQQNVNAPPGVRFPVNETVNIPFPIDNWLFSSDRPLFHAVLTSRILSAVLRRDEAFGLGETGPSIRPARFCRNAFNTVTQRDTGGYADFSDSRSGRRIGDGEVPAHT